MTPPVRRLLASASSLSSWLRPSAYLQDHLPSSFAVPLRFWSDVDALATPVEAYPTSNPDRRPLQPLLCTSCLVRLVGSPDGQDGNGVCRTFVGRAAVSSAVCEYVRKKSSVAFASTTCRRRRAKAEEAQSSEVANTAVRRNQLLASLTLALQQTGMSVALPQAGWGCIVAGWPIAASTGSSCSSSPITPKTR
jgi:hypothetical protein